MFVDDGLAVWFSYGNVVVDNVVNGKPLVYLEEASGLVVGDAGQVVVVRCSNMTVQNLNLSNTDVGIQLWQTNNTKIANNNITANNGYGIWFYDSSNNTIVRNNITANNSGGIWLDGSSNNSMVGNNITNNNGYGIWLYYSSNNSMVGNNITANNGDGISLYDSSNNNSMVGNNITNNNGYGIWLYDSSNNTIVRNNITANNDYGISLYYSSNNSMVGNNITANNWYGIRLDGSSNNSIVGNNITNNDYGIYLYYSSDTILYHNNFIDNTQHAHIHTPGYANVWDDCYPSGGNYWSDYTGVDADGDGIGDDEYVIDANNTDRYPLIAPIGIFDAGVWNGVAYNVDVVSNSTVSDFYFSPDEGAFLRFNVTGTDGTAGFCRVTIPKDLLWVEDRQWSVLVGGEPVDYTIIPDQNFTYLYFTYNHSTKIVVIQGTDVIPEFPSTILLLPFLILSTILSALTKKKHHLRKAKNRPLFSFNSLIRTHSSPGKV